MCRPTKRPRPVSTLAPVAAVGPATVVAGPADFRQTFVFDLKAEPCFDMRPASAWETEFLQEPAPLALPEDSRPRTFVFTTYDMVSDAKNAMAIGFNEEGNVIEIRDLDILSEKILPQYFRHKNVTSFYRQLNSYGFRTTRSSITNVVHAFSHDLFRAGRPDLLSGIFRKKCAKKVNKAKEEEQALHSQVSPPSPMSVSSGSSDEMFSQSVVHTKPVVAQQKRMLARPASIDVETLRQDEVRAAEYNRMVEARNRELVLENKALSMETDRIVASVNEQIDVQTSLIAMLFGCEAAKAFSEQSMTFRMAHVAKPVESQPAPDFDHFDGATEAFSLDDDLKILEDIFANEAELLA